MLPVAHGSLQNIDQAASFGEPLLQPPLGSWPNLQPVQRFHNLSDVAKSVAGGFSVQCVDRAVFLRVLVRVSHRLRTNLLREHDPEPAKARRAQSSAKIRSISRLQLPSRRIELLCHNVDFLKVSLEIIICYS